MTMTKQTLDQIIDSYLCNADLSGGERPKQMADALLAVMPWTGDDYSADTIRAELIDTIEHRQVTMAKQTMRHETAMFASFFTAPEGQDELDYLREAQDALDTSQPGAMAAYGALQNRIVAVSESRLPKYHVWCNACEFGEIEARDEQEARDLAAQMAGYASEADMVERLGQPSELVAREV